MVQGVGVANTKFRNIAHDLGNDGLLRARATRASSSSSSPDRRNFRSRTVTSAWPRRRRRWRCS